MLNKESIHQLLINPKQIGAEETSHLGNLLKEYPYAATLNLLYLKGLKNTQDLSYEKQLPKTSIQAPNREILYQFIIQEGLKEAIEKEIETINEDQIIPESKTEVTEKTESKETIDTLENKPIIDELEETILSEVSSYSIEILTPKETESTEKKSTTKPSKQSFTSWLNTGNEVNSTSLIDDFITKNPSISPNKSDIYTAPNVAKMSIIEDEGFVTETLARVYMKQGHFDKAIKTYQKLSLKIPEKKAFFASQIEVIQELKKQEEK